MLIRIFELPQTDPPNWLIFILASFPFYFFLKKAPKKKNLAFGGARGLPNPFKKHLAQHEKNT